MRIFIFLLLIKLLFTPLIVASSDKILNNYENENFPKPNDTIEIDIFPEIIYCSPLEYFNSLKGSYKQRTVWIKALVGVNGEVVKSKI